MGERPLISTIFEIVHTLIILYSVCSNGRVHVTVSTSIHYLSLPLSLHWPSPEAQRRGANDGAKRRASRIGVALACATTATWRQKNCKTKFANVFQAHATRFFLCSLGLVQSNVFSASSDFFRARRRSARCCLAGPKWGPLATFFSASKVFF